METYAKKDAETLVVTNTKDLTRREIEDRIMMLEGEKSSIIKSIDAEKAKLNLLK